MSLGEIPAPLLGVGAILGRLLVDLMTQILALRLRRERSIQLLSGIKLGDEVAVFNTGTIRYQPRQRELSILADNLRHHHFR